MKRALIWSALAIPILINAQEALWVWVGMAVLSIIRLRKKAWLFIGLSLLAFVSFNGRQWFPAYGSSVIVELHDRSFVVSTPQGKILVSTQSVELYDLMDEVVVGEFEPFELIRSTTGFDQKAYIEAQNLMGKADEDQVRVIRKNPIMTLIRNSTLNDDRNYIRLYRAILFQSDPNLDFIALISLGLIYMMIFKSGRFVLSFIMNETASHIIMLGLLITMAFLFAYPLSLMRVIVSCTLNHWVKNGKDRLVFYSFFFLVFSPSTLTSMTVLYPFLFMVFGAFQLHRIDRWSVLSWIQITFFHRTSLWTTLLYPMMRKGMALMIALVWAGFWIPWLNPMINFYHKIFQQVLSFLERILILRGSLTLPVLFMLSLMIMISSNWKGTGSNLRYLLVFTIPFLCLPWAYQVTLLSVGQGDAIVLQAPFNQEVIMIDTGKASAYRNVSAFLDAQGISRIDALIITHQDNDHSGNADRLIQDYHVMRSVTTANDLDSRWFHLKNLKTSMEEPDDNQGSLVTMLQINKIRFLFMADAEVKREADLLALYPDLKADILKVGHHGSSGSSSAYFLSHIQARLGLISVGENDYGHPSPLTMERLKSAHVQVMTTRDEGDIQFIFSEFFTGLQTSSMKLKPLSLRF